MAITRSITVLGGNLFAIALAELGDATQAVRIAQLNHISDWFLPDGVSTTLQIPPVDAANTSGLPQQ
jgi:putative Ca2+/H+ antiporter (TMEM165/GDT1 family)